MKKMWCHLIGRSIDATARLNPPDQDPKRSSLQSGGRTIDRSIDLETNTAARGKKELPPSVALDSIVCIMGSYLNPLGRIIPPAVAVVVKSAEQIEM